MNEYATEQLTYKIVACPTTEGFEKAMNDLIRSMKGKRLVGRDNLLEIKDKKLITQGVWFAEERK